MFQPHSYQYTTPLLNSWQQFSPPEIHNHICDSRSRHSARAEAKVVSHFVVNSSLLQVTLLLLHMVLDTY